MCCKLNYGEQYQLIKNSLFIHDNPLWGWRWNYILDKKYAVARFFYNFNIFATSVNVVRLHEIKLVTELILLEERSCYQCGSWMLHEKCTFHLHGKVTMLCVCLFLKGKQIHCFTSLRCHICIACWKHYHNGNNSLKHSFGLGQTNASGMIKSIVH